MLVFMKELMDKFYAILLTLFPLSPFAPFIADLDELPFLGYLNWFIPIGTLCKMGSVWLVAIGTYYLYSVLARWVKIIK